ncbi:photosystem II cytochrome PsbV2 [filamentous cyanobacterium LEGE 11480]|uniref:Photosystem II cytochrome PsbV2 n=2 Tax=Romeriopsis TaxID=2992131 RepID=A0A928VRM4_9CYAN|nr:photosystem II cytochrome PsbV2 [Romeriopsis navalis LEGE 11480]
MLQMIVWLGTRQARAGVLVAIGCLLVWTSLGSVAIAAPDPYITQFMKVFPSKPATMTLDSAGTTKVFAYDDMVEGKALFAQNCLSCHVGGSTLSSPEVSLALPALQGATPPRDTVESMMAYIRHPLAYDGTDDNYSCREVDEDWLSNDQVEKISAFILRAAEYAKGWGTSQF